MSTYIHGIAASENIDSSGEVVSIAGLDISTLDKDGLFNYEHELSKVPDKDGKMIELQVKIPAQVVGKILKARKIFSEKDCEDDHQMNFWNKIKTPYLYVMGELFDDYTDAARDLAGKFRYDADHREQNKFNVTGFSVEGAKVKTEGMMVLKSIARKITLTTLPCNKAAIAEMVSVGGKEKDDLSNIFKTESNIEIEILKFSENDKLLELIKNEDPNKHAAMLGLKPMKKDDGLSIGSGSGVALSGVGPSGPSLSAAEKPMNKPVNSSGTKIGLTRTGKSVLSHGRVGEYAGFSHEDHKDAAGLHQKLAEASKDPKMAQHHGGKAQLHQGAANTMVSRLAARAPMKKFEAQSTANGGDMVAEPQKSKPAPAPEKKIQTSMVSTTVSVGMGGTLAKAMEAGSGTSAPAQAVQGAALKKSKWLARAEQEYANWNKREQFQQYMQKRMPHLHKGEIDAIGKTLALKKSMDAEASMNSLVKARVDQGKTDEAKVAARGSLKTGFRSHGIGAGGVHTQYNIGDKDTPGHSLAGGLAREKHAIPGALSSAKDEHRAKLGQLKAMSKPNLTKSEGSSNWSVSNDHRGQVHTRELAGHKVHVFPIPGQTSAGHRVEHHSPHDKSGPTSHDVPGGVDRAKLHASGLLKCCS